MLKIQVSDFSSDRQLQPVQLIQQPWKLLNRIFFWQLFLKQKQSLFVVIMQQGFLPYGDYDNKSEPKMGWTNIEIEKRVWTKVRTV